jgi:hypothetical protein
MTNFDVYKEENLFSEIIPACNADKVLMRVLCFLTEILYESTLALTLHPSNTTSFNFMYPASKNSRVTYL